MFNDKTEIKDDIIEKAKKADPPNRGMGRKEYRRQFGGKSTGHRSKAPRHIASRKIKRG